MQAAFEVNKNPTTTGWRAGIVVEGRDRSKIGEVPVAERVFLRLIPVGFSHLASDPAENYSSAISCRK